MEKIWNKESKTSELRDVLTEYYTHPSSTLAKLKILAEEGSIMAPMYIGCMYRDGLGVDKNLDEAEVWLSKSVNLGNSQAKIHLCDIYDSRGNQELLFGALTDLANDDNPQAMTRLAVIYQKSAYADYDGNKVHDLLRRAHQLGNVWGTKMLAKFYATGKNGILYIPMGIFLYIYGLLKYMLIFRSDKRDPRLQ